MYDTNGRNSVMGNSLSTLTVAEFLKRVKDRNDRLYVSEDVSLNYMLNYSIHKNTFVAVLVLVPIIDAYRT